jgi:hypothetical protein
VRHLDLNDAETGGLDAIQPAEPVASTPAPTVKS